MDARTTEATDELYTASPAEFVERRDALVRELKQQDRGAAKEVKRLRKPTQAAWALNTVTRRRSDDVAELRRLGRRLRSAQEEAVAGEDVESLRECAALRRSTIRELTDEATELVGESHRDAIEAALDAASLDDATGEQLQRGRLTKPPARRSGMAALSDIAVGERSGPARAKPDRRVRRRLRRELGRAEQQLRRDQDRLEQAEKRLARAEAEVERARSAVERDRQRRRELVDELEETSA